MTTGPLLIIMAVTATLAFSTGLAIGKTINWPSLEFQFTIKHTSMNVHGRSEFSMLANPVVSDNGYNVLYNVFSSFTEDQTVHNYTLFNGVGYYSSSPKDGTSNPYVDCLDSDLGKLPPINEIIRAINEATAVSSVQESEHGVIECQSDNLFKVSVNSFDFALCTSASSGFTMQWSDMDVNVKYLDSAVEIHSPSPNANAKNDCRTLATPSSITSIGKSLLTGQPILDEVRNLKPALDFSFSRWTSCSCSSTPRPCIFIHGMGVEEEMPENQDNFTEYWGDHLADSAPCCSSMKFAHLDTVNNTWTSAKQQQKVCDRALAVSDTSTDSIITDTIVVTHSMGNLMVAGAIANGRCSLDASSTWVGLAAPMKGSMASDFVQEACAGEVNIVWEKIGNITGRCPASTALKSLAYQGGNHSTDELDAAYTAAQEVYQKHVHAAMCSKWYSGIPSRYQFQFWALGATVPHKSSKNDGQVEFQSCAAGLPEEEFDDTWKSRFYSTRLNHYDMEFLSGDSLLNGDKMPVKWFECLL